MTPTPITHSAVIVTEEQIAQLVRQFYSRARKDSLIGPVFEAMIADWEEHFTITQNFWSNLLLGTGRYQGHPFPPHMRMPLEPESFDRWLELFIEAANETLPEAAAKEARAKASHMANAFKIGLFPWKTPDGKMSKHKP
jgi:hemoglobin